MAPKKPKDQDIKNKIKKAKTSADKNIIENNVKSADKEIKKIKRTKSTDITEKVSLMTSFALAKISNNLAHTADRLNDMAINTTENLINGVREYTSAITEEFGVSKHGLVAMSLAQISPVFGHFVAKFMETSMFRNMVDRFKERFFNTISLTSRAIFNLIKSPLLLPQKILIGSKGLLNLFRTPKEKRDENKLRNISRLSYNTGDKKSIFSFFGSGGESKTIPEFTKMMSSSTKITRIYQEQSLRELTFIRTAVNQNLPGLFQKLWARFQENHNRLAATLKTSFYLATAPFRVIRWAVRARGGYKSLLPSKPDLISVLGTSFVWTMIKFDAVINHLREIITATRDISNALTGKSYGPMPFNPIGRMSAYRGGKRWSIAGEAWRAIKAPFVLGQKIFNKFSENQQIGTATKTTSASIATLTNQGQTTNLNVKRNIILSMILNINKLMNKTLKGILNSQIIYNSSFKKYASSTINLSTNLLKNIKNLKNYVWDIGKYLLTAFMLLASFVGKFGGSIGGKIAGSAAKVVGGVVGGKIFGKILRSGAGKAGGTTLGNVLSVGNKILGPGLLVYEGYEGYNKKEEWFKDRKIGTREKVASIIGGSVGGTSSGELNAVSQGLKTSSLGSLFGGGIGLLVGGGPGALLGARLGALAGGAGGALAGYVGGEKIARAISGEKPKDTSSLENIEEKTSNLKDMIISRQEKILKYYEESNELKNKNENIQKLVKKAWKIVTEPFSHLKKVLKSAKEIEENIKNDKNIKELEIEMGTAPARISASIIGGVLGILSTVPYTENAVLILKDKYEQLRRSIGMVGGEKLETAKDKFRNAISGIGDLSHNLLFAATGIGKSALTGLGTLTGSFGTGQAHAATMPGTSVGSGIVGSPSSGGVVSAGGAVHQNVALVANKLMEAGLSKEAVAGIIGNLQQESGQNLNPNAKNSIGAFGIAQWLSKDRVANLQKFAAAKGKPINDLETQAEFLVHEMKSGADSGASKAFKLLQNAKTPEEASDIFFKYYERAGDSSGERRRQYARRVLQNLTAGFSPNQATAAMIPQMTNLNAANFSNAVSALASGNMKAANCGDASALLINSELQAKGGKTLLPRGGLDSGSIIRIANSYGAPVLQGGQITLESLRALGPGTIIRYDRGQNHPYRKYGKDHAETIAIKPGTNELAILSHSGGTRVRWKALDENYIRNELGNTSNLVASNILRSPQIAPSVAQEEQTTNQAQVQAEPAVSMDIGGYINKTQPILAHKGEVIAPIEKVGSAFVDAAASNVSFLKNIAKEIVPGEIDIDRRALINSKTNDILAQKDILNQIVATIGKAISESMGQLSGGIGSIVNNAINMVSNSSQQVSNSASGGNNTQQQDFGINIDGYIAQILRGDLD